MPYGMKMPRTFWNRVRVQEDGCWVWTGAVVKIRRKDGSVRAIYGWVYCAPGHTSAHILSYEQCIGPVPDGYDLDHLCRNTLCVHPLHLEPVPPAVNVQRGMSPSAVSRRSGYCLRGHLLSPENTYVSPKGGRACRTCIRALAEQKNLKLRLSRQQKRLTDPVWAENERERSRRNEERRRGA